MVECSALTLRDPWAGSLVRPIAVCCGSFCLGSQGLWLANGGAACFDGSDTCCPAGHIHLNISALSLFNTG